MKAIKEPTVLIECNFIVEVGQSVAAKGEHSKYIDRIVRGMLQHNKQIKEIIDIDAFEPESYHEI